MNRTLDTNQLVGRSRSAGESFAGNFQINILLHRKIYSFRIKQIFSFFGETDSIDHNFMFEIVIELSYNFIQFPILKNSSKQR